MRPIFLSTSITRRNHIRLIWNVGIIIFFLLFTFFNNVFAEAKGQYPKISDSIKIEIEKQLTNPEILNQFNFPNTVKRFYELTVFKANWLRTEQKTL